MENATYNSVESEIAECKNKLIDQLELTKNDMTKDGNCPTVPLPPIKRQGTASYRRPSLLTDRGQAIIRFRMKKERVKY